MSDRMRTALAFFLIVVILLLWTVLSRRKTPDEDVGETVVQDTMTTLLKDTISDTEITDLSEEDTIVIDHDEVSIVLSSYGGSIKHYVLKEYGVDVVPENKALFITRINSTVCPTIQHSVHGDTVRFVHIYKDMTISKTYIFNDPHGFDLAVDIPESHDHLLDLLAGIRVTEAKNESEDLRHFNVYVKQEKVEAVKGRIKDTYDVHGEIDWFALRSKYFLLVVNINGALDNLHFLKLEKTETAFFDPVQDVKRGMFGCYYLGRGGNRYGAEILTHTDLSLSVKLLPVKYSILGSYKESYEKVTSGGILGPISRLFLAIFNLLYALFKNYGVAIIVFAICIKLIFFPLSRQMIKSQHRMQMIQPELKKLQKKFKEDPQRLNQEMMHLYKTYKVNPFTGCLPLVVQMPIFFALYQTLLTSIEFRNAPFMLWITDLSFKDPYYILPIAMGVMMLVQSFLTTIDPRQRYMTIIMPIFMVFIFLNFPSGLQLYWFSYNILTLVEHIITRRGGIK